MRILRIADVPDNRTGGMSRTMHATGDRLRQRGHTVHCVWTEQLNVFGPVQLRRFFVPLKIRRLICKLTGRGEHYDVVEIHEPLAAPYAWARRRHRGLAPLVIFSYGLEERSHQAMLSYRRLKGLPVTLKNRFSPLSVVWQARYAVCHADHVICSNTEDVRHLQKAGVEARRLTCHTSGVDGEFLEAGKLSELPGRAGILFLGSWLMRKGILDVVPVMTQLLRQQPALQFTVAGCGVAVDRVLFDFAPDLRSRICVLPSVATNQELITLYRRHAVLLLPSYFEGHPLVMVEAAALGMAVVTTSICGMIDFITHRKNGLLVPVGDVPTLIASLQELLQNPALARQLGNAARLVARQHTWEAAAEKIEAAYRAATKPSS